jgi:hypothetical protein
MKSRTHTKNHTNAAPIRKAWGKGTFRGIFALLAALVTILSVIGLSSCAGYTAAAGPAGPASTGLLTPSATTLTFGSVPVAGTATQSISVTNTGTATVNVSQVTISGTGFTVIGGSASPSIPVGQSSTVQVQFSPQSTGAITGAITVTSDASNSPLTVSLTGAGSAPVLAISPVAVNFGSVSVGQNGSQSIKLTNTGTSVITISAASSLGAGFGMNGLTAGQTIAAGANVSFNATFTPTGTGSVTGSISITSNAPGSPASIALTGTGAQAVGSANPTSVAFGSVVMGTNHSQSITLKNTGNTTLTFSQVNVTGGPAFTITGLSTATTIAAGASMSFNAIFTPSSTTAVSGSIALTTNGSPAVLTIPLSGTGSAATVQLGSNPTSLAFGEVNINTNSSLTSVLTNTGNTSITISGVTTAGTGITASGVSSGLVLSPTQTATLTVKFAPTATGTLTGGSVTVTSNAPTLVIGLTGITVQHSVSLSWTGSTTSGVTGYYVYRSTTAGSGYGRLNSGSPVPAPTTIFTDSTVQPGQSYFYVVTSVDSTGTESANSNQATAPIP